MITLTSTIVATLFTTLARAANVTHKAGLAWAGSPAQMPQFEQAGTVSWYYNWGPRSWTPDSGLEFVPMLWGTRQIDSFVSTINDTIESHNVSTILGPNEPNLGEQANLTVAEAIGLWLTYMQPLKARGIRLASAAPTSAPSGLVWLQEFINYCPMCTVDIVAIHWYGTNPDGFIDYVNRIHGALNRTIWVTEWACHNFVNASDRCTPESVIHFMNKTQDFLESSPFVERYAWFGAKTDLDPLEGLSPVNALMNPDGSISSLGLQYIGLGSFVATSENSTANSTFQPIPPSIVFGSSEVRFTSRFARITLSSIAAALVALVLCL